MFCLKIPCFVATVGNSPNMSFKVSAFGATKTASKCPNGHWHDPICWLVEDILNSCLLRYVIYCRNVDLIRIKQTKLTCLCFAQTYSAIILFWWLSVAVLWLLIFLCKMWNAKVTQCIVTMYVLSFSLWMTSFFSSLKMKYFLIWSNNNAVSTFSYFVTFVKRARFSFDRELYLIFNMTRTKKENLNHFIEWVPTTAASGVQSEFELACWPVISTPNVLTDPFLKPPSSPPSVESPPPVKYSTTWPTFNNFCEEISRWPILMDSLPQSHNSLADQEVIFTMRVISTHDQTEPVPDTVHAGRRRTFPVGGWRKWHGWMSKKNIELS